MSSTPLLRTLCRSRRMPIRALRSVAALVVLGAIAYSAVTGRPARGADAPQRPSSRRVAPLEIASQPVVPARPAAETLLVSVRSDAAEQGTEKSVDEINAPESVEAAWRLLDDAYAADACDADDTALPAGENGESIEAEALPTVEACAGDCPHELWIVSTRNLPDVDCGCPLAPFTPEVERYICGSGWISASLDELMAEDDRLSTAIFVHGNDYNADHARDLARQLYCRLFASGCPTPPTRLVIWSWPSERVLCRRRPDVQLKACRTNIEAYYLATFIDSLPGDTHPSIAGFSYGARVVTGGLHLLGDGTLAGRQLVDKQNPGRQASGAILLGAAMDNDWLLPGRRHERALSQVDHLVILINSGDAVLHFYPYLWGRGGAEALGVTGVASMSRLGPERAKVQQVNVRPALHHRHAWKYFSSSPSVMSLVRRELVYAPAGK